MSSARKDIETTPLLRSHQKAKRQRITGSGDDGGMFAGRQKNRELVTYCSLCSLVGFLFGLHSTFGIKLIVILIFTGIIITVNFGSRITYLISKYRFEEEEQPRTDVFLSHSWGERGLNYSDHTKVKNLKEALELSEIDSEHESRPISIWFDEEVMFNNVRELISKGIQKSSCAIICITKDYSAKIGHWYPLFNNCYNELEEMNPHFVIPIVLEKEMLDRDNWHPLLQQKLGSLHCLDFSDIDLEIPNQILFSRKIEELKAVVIEKLRKRNSIRI
jgi:hypothetical protein